jgi:hypothetical protein
VKVLAHLQEELEAVFAVTSEHRVEDFVVSRAILDRMGLGAPRADEEVLVLQDREELSLAVYLAPHVLAAIEDVPDSVGELLARGLSTFCLALEGVSHFLYLVNRATVPRPVSLLELEVQAEIDKFALSALHLWRRGARGEVPALLRRLFDEVSYLPGLEPEAAERYRTANRLARNYCQALLRHVEDGRVEGLLGELRRSYRLGGGEKIGHMGRLLH